MTEPRVTHTMGLMDQPTAFFGGGRVIKGDIELTGEMLQDPVRIGSDAQTLSDTMAVGVRAKALGQKSVALGNNARALGADATAIGTETTAPANWNTVIGYDAGSINNGNNVVLVGRKSEARGNNGVAIGELAVANGENSTAVGRGTQSHGDNSSAYGQGASVTGNNATAIGQGISLSQDNATLIGTDSEITSEGGLAIGQNVTVTGENATAVGKGAEANGVNSLAVGSGTVVNDDNGYGFGDRDLLLSSGRSVKYSDNAGLNSLADIPVTADSPEDEQHSYTLNIGGEQLLSVSAKSDGLGGIQDKLVKSLSRLSTPDIDLSGKTSNPDLVPGLIWYRSDQKFINMSTDGSTVQRIGWDF